MKTVSFDDCHAEAESDNALLVHIPDVSDDAVWIPKSKKVLDREESEVQNKGDEGTLVIAEWFAIEKEWI